METVISEKKPVAVRTLVLSSLAGLTMFTLGYFRGRNSSDTSLANTSVPCAQIAKEFVPFEKVNPDSVAPGEAVTTYAILSLRGADLDINSEAPKNFFGRIDDWLSAPEPTLSREYWLSAPSPVLRSEAERSAFNAVYAEEPQRSSLAARIELIPRSGGQDAYSIMTETRKANLPVLVTGAFNSDGIFVITDVRLTEGMRP